MFILSRFAAIHQEEDGTILVGMFWCQMPKDLQTRMSFKKRLWTISVPVPFSKIETEDCTWDQSKVILEEFRSLQIAEQCANTLRPSCWISVWLHDLVTERVPFPKRTWSPTRTANVLLTAVDPMNIPLKTHRFEANQPTHNETHWFASKFVQEEGMGVQANHHHCHHTAEICAAILLGKSGTLGRQRSWDFVLKFGEGAGWIVGLARLFVSCWKLQLSPFERCAVAFNANNLPVLWEHDVVPSDSWTACLIQFSRFWLKFPRLQILLNTSLNYCL